MAFPRGSGLLNTLKKRARRLWLKISNKELFMGLTDCKSETVGNTQSVPKKKEKSRALIVKSAFLRRLSPAFLASGWPSSR